ncbi:type 1 glutamine amidotransferase domain-containing protein [Rubrivivax gelatinosus]|uniref:type 1 glutamine amidotransferase domain-containing protein n=1 Tax=Rubrivivax gelatinosus TaxID=28068 RepID=UPI00030CBA6E|nr:type 1 glutamine amidotransferase domain-containing protein [Rubrivivax gelatinosus]MBG6082093.1 putative intracellular protease/amidase [Rubrivivax gelatinosus]
MNATQTRTTRPVLIVLTSHGSKGASGEPTGFYLGEATHPMAVLQDAGIPVELASIQGGEPPVDGLDLDDPVNRRYWDDPAFRETLRHTPRLDEVDASRYAAILLAGGHGAVWDFPDSPAVQRQTRAVWEQGGVVAAVCHGPAALVNVRLSDGSFLVAGRHLAAFTDDEERAVKLEHVVPFLLASTLAERGAIHHASPNWTPSVQVDGRLVTGQNPQSAHGVGVALRDLLQRDAG